MGNIYVVEHASEEWGEHHDWHESFFSSLDEAKEFAMQKCLEGNAVRMYIKEKQND